MSRAEASRFMPRLRCIAACAVLVAALPSTVSAASSAQVPPAATRIGQLPRVFFTPAERARITTARLAGRPLPAAQIVTPGEAPLPGVPMPPAVPGVDAGGASRDAAQPPPVRSARIEGLTVGRGAPAAVWIGGERVVDGGRWGRWRVQVRRDGARLTAADGTTRDVRVGMELQP